MLKLENSLTEIMNDFEGLISMLHTIEESVLPEL